MLNSEWPVTEGRFTVGNPKSAVAVCTMASLDLEFPKEKVAISGKAVTENLGIEKIIKNTISNKNIKYIILCGKISKGHFIGQAIKCLVEKGVDQNRRIIDAKGAMPVLKNVSMNEIEEFRKQITPVDMIGETDVNKIVAKIDELNSQKTQDQSSASSIHAEPLKQEIKIPVDVPKESRVEEIFAEESEAWEQDKEGFFIIYTDKVRNLIKAEHFSNDRTLQRIISGKSAQAMMKKIASLNIVSNFYHAAYLGKELSKAEIALRNGFEYIQDKDLEVPVRSVETEKKFLSVIRVSRTYLCGGKSSFTISEDIVDEKDFIRTINKAGLYRVF